MYIQNFDTLYVISDLHMGGETGFGSSSDPLPTTQAGSA